VKRHSALALTVATAALFVAPTMASAATSRYASPTGSGPAPCLEPTPCSAENALTGAASGDTVVLKPGTYTPTGGLQVTAPNVAVIGEAGSARPVIQFPALASNGLTFAATAIDSQARRLKIQMTAGGPPGATALAAYARVALRDVETSGGDICVTLNAAGSTIEDSKLTQGTPPAPAPCLTSVFDGTTVRNVEVSSAAPSGPGVGPEGVVLNGAGVSVDRLVVKGARGATIGGSFAPGSQPIVMRRSRIESTGTGLTIARGAVVSDTVATTSAAAGAAVVSSGGKLRNVTAVATGAASNGLRLLAEPAPGPAATSVRNSILRGQTTDFVVDPGAPAGPPQPWCVAIPAPFVCPPTPALLPGDLTITHSNFRPAGLVNSASGFNQATDPLLGADFRPAAASPAIDAGTDDADNGTLDLDGKQRKLGAAVDIGAFEFTPPAPTPSDPLAAPATPGGITQPDVPLAVGDSVSPALSALGITNTVFAVAPQATPVAARARRGTTFVYTLSEPARVAIAIERSQPGRRKGASCVKPTRKNRTARRCTRFVKIANFSRTATLGPNALPFSGRIGTKALAPGSYRAVMTAVDAAGNRSRPKTVAFRIVRR
jgi:hypothetical protein